MGLVVCHSPGKTQERLQSGSSRIARFMRGLDVHVIIVAGKACLFNKGVSLCIRGLGACAMCCIGWV